MTRAYRLHGLKLDSDFDLPALPSWDGPMELASDIAIRRGTVAPRLDRADHVAPLFQTRGGGEYLLALPGTGRILVRNGSAVTVEPDSDADEMTTSAILTGPIQGVLWHQRGLLPLHAAVVLIDGRAVALCGHAAAGKSTLAAMLAARGCAVIADDICLIDGRDRDQVSVVPGGARLRMWRDALDHIGRDASALERALSEQEAYFLDCNGPVSSERHKLAAALIISRWTIGTVGLKRIHGVWAVATLERFIHMRRPAAALGRAPHIFADLTRLASSGATVWRLRVPEGAACLDEAAATIPTVLEA